MVSISNLTFSGLGLMALSVSAANSSQSPEVTVSNGTYAGRYSPHYDQDYFLGMPYAQPAERFTAAKELNTSWEGSRPATEYSPNCVSYTIEEQGHILSEDCLYLNVIRPAGIDDTADLPVAVWIHGGGLTTGGSAYERYNMSFIVERSVEMGTPIIGVSLNYRLTAYGFLSGGEATEAGISNNGFRDQRLALRWVNENIAAFGGSPEKVTIFGESAGATSVTAQVVAYNGRDDGLFRGVIGQSGFGSMLPNGFASGLNATDEIDQVYNDLVSSSSCSDLVGQPGSLECLRSVPREELDHALNVTGIGPFPARLDGDFLQDYPTNQLANGDFVRVPLLIGSNTDEGSDMKDILLGGRLVNTDAEMREAIITKVSAQKTDKTTEEIVDEVMHLYPNDQSVGIPSLETWPHVIQPNDSYAEMLGAQYRRATALAGDLAMHWPRRRANRIWNEHGVPSWTYHFDVVPNGIEPYVGASHFKEVAFVFYNLNGDGMPIPPFGGEEPHVSQAKAVAKEMSSAWINFFNNLDPNGDPGMSNDGSQTWPKFGPVDDGGVGRGIVFDLDGSYEERDDFRKEGIDWIIENALAVFGL